MRDFRVADQLERDDAPRARDVVVAHAVEVAFNRNDREAVDVLDVCEHGLNRLGIRDVEGDAAHIRADLLRDAGGALGVAARDHDLAAGVRVELRDRAADPARATDYDASLDPVGFEEGLGLMLQVPLRSICSAMYSQSRAKRYEFRAGGCGDCVSSQRTVVLLRL